MNPLPRGVFLGGVQAVNKSASTGHIGITSDAKSAIKSGVGSYCTGSVKCTCPLVLHIII